MSKKSRNNKGTTTIHSASKNRNISQHVSLQNNKYIHYLILFALTFLLFGWTYRFEYSLSDPYVLNAVNSLDNSLHGFFSVFKQTFAGDDYRPISIMTFWLERFIFGSVSPHISHLVNVFILWLILIKIYDFIKVSKFYDDEKKLMLLALLCSLFFLIHPNHVSVVANIKSRDNLLSMLFGLMATIQVIKFYDKRNYRRLPLIFIYFVLGFLSKLDVYIFVIVPLMVILFYRNPAKNNISYLIITTIIATVFFYELKLILSPVKIGEHAFNLTFDKNPLVADDTFINRLSLMFTSLYYYVKFLFVPVGYHFIFGYNQIPVTSLFSIKNILAALIMLLFLLLSLKKYKQNKIYLFAFLFFIFSIAYALNFIDLIANIIMDRYNFIPSLAFCLALSAIFIDIYNPGSFDIFKKPFILLLVAFMTFFTVYRTKDWKNLITLVDHDMPYLTNSVNAYRIAGSAYINVALQEEMQPNYNKAYADSMINVGERYTLDGIKLYDNEVELWQSKGLCLFYRKDFPAALTCFLKCNKIDSSYLSAWNYAGFTYWKLNKTDSAYYYFNYVMNRENAFGYSANNMINMLIENNRRKEADSIINVLKDKYPDDLWLKNKIQELK